jgi:hypothetical protein
LVSRRPAVYVAIITLTKRIIAAAAAGGLAAAAYLDGKYQIRRELNYIRKFKKAEKEYAKAGTYSDQLSKVGCTNTTAQSKKTDNHRGTF